MKNQLEKALKLAKKTKDKIILIDSSDPENSFVILGLDDYEKIIDEKANFSHLTEEDMIDKINRDIAEWKNENETENSANVSDVKEVDLSENIEDDKMYYYEAPESNRPQTESEEIELNVEPVLKNEEAKKSKSNWRIPTDVKEAAEEVIEDIPF